MAAPLADALAAFRSGQLDRAHALASAALVAAPGSAPIHHLIGLVDCRLGRMESGVEHLRRAVAVDPGNAAFRIMLARALTDSGKAAEALSVAARPTGSQPQDAALWQARAEAASAAAEHDTAAEAWACLAGINPDDWRAWNNAGNALAALGRWSDAADALERAAALNPRETTVRRNLAAALAEAGRTADAAEALGPLVASEPHDARLRLLHAEVLTALGRYDEALAALDEAARLATEGGGLLTLATRPDEDRPDAEAVRKVGRLLERTNRLEALRSLLADAAAVGIERDSIGLPAAAIALRDGDAAEAKRLLLAEDPTLDPVPWHRLLSKVEDKLDAPDAAFAAAEAMNRAVPDFGEWRTRGAAYRARVRELAALATPEWTAQLATALPSVRRSPAFLVGFPRSGTTLLDTFLMGHPDATVLEEVPLLGAAETILGPLAELPNRGPADLGRARDAYFAELDRHLDPAFDGLVVDKLPLNMIGLPIIAALFPDARIIFAQRHPADVVLSGFMQNFVLNDAMACFLDIGDAADLYDAALTAFTRQRDALALKIHDLVYEGLIADPEATLRPLVSFLGLAWRDELLDHQATARGRGPILTPSYDQVVQPLSNAASGRWRRYAQPLSPVLPLLLQWAKRLGYPDEAVKIPN